jgi:SAM-dependent methyltransferase
MWAVLTGPLAAGRAWDADAFFATGVEEVDFVLGRVRAVGAPREFTRALDFGCGVGRLTHALGRHFTHVDGVDIAPAMIEKAKALNRLADRCHYHLNERADLSVFETATFDFVYSSITLQHMEPRFSRVYIEEFFRIARPGGVVVFQIPGEPVAVYPPRTRCLTPMPRDACRASIEVPASLRCAPGAVVPLRAMVRNDGAYTWPCMGEEDGRFSLRLGNHWRGRFKRMLKFDDARAQLAHDVPPGHSIPMLLPIEALRKPGTYTLELDMVQEHVHWFAEYGSPQARIRVHIDRAMPPGEVQGLPTEMQMHGIPRAEVESIVARCGGVLLAADDNDAPGPGWTSYRYIARR